MHKVIPQPQSLDNLLISMQMTRGEAAAGLEELGESRIWKLMEARFLELAAACALQSLSSCRHGAKDGDAVRYAIQAQAYHDFSSMRLALLEDLRS